MNDFLKQSNQCIILYFGKETILDPYEKNVEVSIIDHICIPATITDLIASQINWKLPGIKTSKAKEIFIDKQYRTLLEDSYKIGLKENNIWLEFEGWKDNGRMQIREIGDLLRLYVYIKNE